MKGNIGPCIIAVVFLFLVPSCLFADSATVQNDHLALTGKITNLRGNAVGEAGIEIFLNGKILEAQKGLRSSDSGTFETDITLDSKVLETGTLEIRVSKPSFKTVGPVEIQHVLRDPNCGNASGEYLAYSLIQLPRSITPAFWIAACVLLVVYIIIALELMHRTLASLFGASIILFISYTAGTFSPDYFILSFEDAISAIDFNVIGLLMGMMMIVGVLKKTGVFQWLSYKSYELAGGNVFVLGLILMLVTALCSALLDNVTTMLLMIPVTIEIALTLKINPITLLMPEVFASNVGGTATLIGDPPNIMIGSYANLTFMDFIVNIGPICVIGLLVSIAYFLFLYKKEYSKGGADAETVQLTMARLREEYRITDVKLLFSSGVILVITIVLFVLHGYLGMEPCIAAMTSAAILLMISRVDIVEMLEHEIEWPTLIFFSMLFIVVAGAEETGLIQVIADWVNHMSQGSLVTAILIILWVSAIASAIIDNIPFTATMLPIVAYLTEVIPGAQSGVLWWALALGACLGGNGTMIGASANVITVGMAERAGYHISFMKYLRIAFVPMLITIVLASAWLLIAM